MPLFTKFNMAAVAARRPKPEYRRIGELLPMRLHKVEDASFETTTKGEAVKLVLTTAEGHYVFLYVDIQLDATDVTELKTLVQQDQAPFFFTAFGQGHRLNGLVPYGKNM